MHRFHSGQAASVRHRVFLALLPAFLAVSFAQAQHALAPRPPRYAAVVEAARALVQQHVARENLPGLDVAVSVDGETVWSEGFGYADLEHRVPVWPTTKFRIASISKPLTAAAVARLYEEGRLDLDAPVQQYVPSFPVKPYPITTRQLGGHLAGIRHYRGDEYFIRDRYTSVAAGLALFANDSLLHAPGTAYAYTSLRFGHAHLGDGFLSPEARAMLFAEQQTTAGEGVGYGFGWALNTDEKGRRRIFHTGGAVGGTSLLALEPDARVVVAVLINLSGASLEAGWEVFDLFVDAVSGTP